MVFKEIKTEGDWVCVEYAATWRYGYDFMLDAVQVLIADFADNLQRIARYEIMGAKPEEIVEEVKSCGGVLRRCKAIAEECGAVAVAGISRVMECPIQIVFYNQTNAVGLDIPIAQMPQDHPLRKIFDERKDGYEHTFDCYMDSVEIKAYCADTERRTLARKTDSH